MQEQTEGKRTEQSKEPFDKLWFANTVYEIKILDTLPDKRNNMSCEMRTDQLLKAKMRVTDKALVWVSIPLLRFSIILFHCLVSPTRK